MKQLARLSFILALLAGNGVPTLAVDSPRFNHAAFYVIDLKISADFYRDVVGLPVIPEPFHDGKHAWFEIGPKQALHIISGAQTVLPKEKRTHLCLSVPSVDTFAARLTKAKVSYEDLAGKKGAITRRPDGVNQIYFQAPDGNWIEINVAKEQARSRPHSSISPCQTIMERLTNIEPVILSHAKDPSGFQLAVIADGFFTSFRMTTSV